MRQLLTPQRYMYTYAVSLKFLSIDTNIMFTSEAGMLPQGGARRLFIVVTYKHVSRFEP